MQKKWIVVTGAAGFIGSCLVRHLNDCGYTHLILVDDLGGDERWKNLVGKQFDDLMGKGELLSWLGKHYSETRAIFHLGACSDTQELDADFLLENNTRYTLRLARFAIAHTIRFIYASSAATYGDGRCGFDDDESKLTSLKPLNMYGFSKHLVDLTLQREGYLNRVVSLKYFNVFGPNEYHKGRMASALVKMAQDARGGAVSLFKSQVPEYGDGEQVRDFIYVKDAVAMTTCFLDNELCGIYNVGSSIACSWNRLAKALIDTLLRQGSHPIAINYIDMPDSLKGKYQNYTRAEMNKWHRAKLPPSRFTVEEAVSDYLDHYLNSRSIW